jgi:hypothetical protein
MDRVSENRLANAKLLTKTFSSCECSFIIRFFLALSFYTMKLEINHNGDRCGRNAWQLNIHIMFSERFPITVDKISSLSLIVIFVCISFNFSHPIDVYFQKSKCLQSSISRSLVLGSDTT